MWNQMWPLFFQFLSGTHRQTWDSAYGQTKTPIMKTYYCCRLREPTIVEILENAATKKRGAYDEDDIASPDEISFSSLVKRPKM